MGNTKCWTKVLGPALANAGVQGENSPVPDGLYLGCNVSFFAVMEKVALPLYRFSRGKCLDSCFPSSLTKQVNLRTFADMLYNTKLF